MKLLSLGAALVIAAVAFTAPTTTPTPPPPPAVVAATPPPIRVAVLYDITYSRDTARISATVDDFAPLFDRLRVSGGEVGFGFIREDSDQPLMRLYVPAPPEPPVLTTAAKGTNIFVNANNTKRNEAEQKKYEAKRRAWEADATVRINSFVNALASLLAKKATAGATDLTAAVERGDLMLAEPSRTTRRDAAIILITDGIHNATAKTTPVLRSGARLAIVNGVGSIGALAKVEPTPLRFESTAAAVRYVAEGGGNVR